MVLKFSLYCACEFSGNKIMESKATLVFPQLNPMIKGFSNNSAILACVGSAITALDNYRWMQPLSELSEVHFRGLYGNFRINFFRHNLHQKSFYIFIVFIVNYFISQGAIKFRFGKRFTFRSTIYIIKCFDNFIGNYSLSPTKVIQNPIIVSFR